MYNFTFIEAQHEHQRPLPRAEIPSRDPGGQSEAQVKSLQDFFSENNNNTVASGTDFTSASALVDKTLQLTGGNDRRFPGGGHLGGIEISFRVGRRQ